MTGQLHPLLQTERPLKWIFCGDSITHGAFHTAGWRDYTELFSERLRYEMRRYDDIIIKVAADGNTTRHLLDAFEWRVGQFHPDVVFLMFGINDCATGPEGPRVPLPEFMENLLSIAGRVQSMGAVPVYQTSGLVLASEAPERAPYLDPYMDAIRQVAQQVSGILIDHQAHWKMQSADLPWRYKLWLRDALHPNEMGHRVFANLIFKEFGIFDPEAATCRLLYL